MFLFIGLLCAGIAGSVIASETTTPAFKALPHITSKKSLDIIAKLHAIHPNLADFCNQASPLKDEEKCKNLLVKLHNGESLDNHSSGTWTLFNDLNINADTEACKKKYQDPIECDICITKAQKELRTAKDSLDEAITQKKFQS